MKKDYVDRKRGREDLSSLTVPPPPKNESIHGEDKVKIRRVKRNKKKSTTQEKILAGFGLASTLLGGAAASASKPPATRVVTRLDSSKDSSRSKTKEFLTSIFGVQTAKADEGDEVITDAPEPEVVVEDIKTDTPASASEEAPAEVPTAVPEVPVETSVETTVETPTDTLSTDTPTDTPEPEVVVEDMKTDAQVDVPTTEEEVKTDTPTDENKVISTPNTGDPGTTARINTEDSTIVTDTPIINTGNPILTTENNGERPNPIYTAGDQSGQPAGFSAQAVRASDNGQTQAVAVLTKDNVGTTAATDVTEKQMRDFSANVAENMAQGKGEESLPASFNADSALAYMLGVGQGTDKTSVTVNGQTYNLSSDGNTWTAQQPTTITIPGGGGSPGATVIINPGPATTNPSGNPAPATQTPPPSTAPAVSTVTASAEETNSVAHDLLMTMNFATAANNSGQQELKLGNNANYIISAAPDGTLTATKVDANGNPTSVTITKNPDGTIVYSDGQGNSLTVDRNGNTSATGTITYQTLYGAGPVTITQTPAQTAPASSVLNKDNIGTMPISGSGVTPQQMQDFNNRVANGDDSFPDSFNSNSVMAWMLGVGDTDSNNNRPTSVTVNGQTYTRVLGDANLWTIVIPPASTPASATPSGQGEGQQRYRQQGGGQKIGEGEDPEKEKITGRATETPAGGTDGPNSRTGFRGDGSEEEEGVQHKGATAVKAGYKFTDQNGLTLTLDDEGVWKNDNGEAFDLGGDNFFHKEGDSWPNQNFWVNGVTWHNNAWNAVLPTTGVTLSSNDGLTWNGDDGIIYSLAPDQNFIPVGQYRAENPTSRPAGVPADAQWISDWGVYGLNGKFWDGSGKALGPADLSMIINKGNAWQADVLGTNGPRVGEFTSEQESSYAQRVQQIFENNRINNIPQVSSTITYNENNQATMTVSGVTLTQQANGQWQDSEGHNFILTTGGMLVPLNNAPTITAPIGTTLTLSNLPTVSITTSGGQNMTLLGNGLWHDQDGKIYQLQINTNGTGQFVSLNAEPTAAPISSTLNLSDLPPVTTTTANGQTMTLLGNGTWQGQDGKLYQLQTGEDGSGQFISLNAAPVTAPISSVLPPPTNPVEGMPYQDATGTNFTYTDGVWKDSNGLVYTDQNGTLVANDGQTKVVTNETTGISTQMVVVNGNLVPNEAEGNTKTQLMDDGNTHVFEFKDGAWVDKGVAPLTNNSNIVWTGATGIDSNGNKFVMVNGEIRSVDQSNSDGSLTYIGTAPTKVVTINDFGQINSDDYKIVTATTPSGQTGYYFQDKNGNVITDPKAIQAIRASMLQNVSTNQTLDDILSDNQLHPNFDGTGNSTVQFIGNETAITNLSNSFNVQEIHSSGQAVGINMTRSNLENWANSVNSNGVAEGGQAAFEFMTKSIPITDADGKPTGRTTQLAIVTYDNNGKPHVILNDRLIPPATANGQGSVSLAIPSTDVVVHEAIHARDASLSQTQMAMNFISLSSNDRVFQMANLLASGYSNPASITEANAHLVEPSNLPLLTATQNASPQELAAMISNYTGLKATVQIDANNGNTQLLLQPGANSPAGQTGGIITIYKDTKDISFTATPANETQTASNTSTGDGQTANP